MVKAAELQHGDVLLYHHNPRYSNLFVKGIRLVTGSKVQHTAIVWEVDGDKFVLEQLLTRSHFKLDFYYDFPGEDIVCVRPLFPIPAQDTKKMFRREDYGISPIVYCMINHFIGLFVDKWQARPFVHKIWQKKLIDCSGLVALILKLRENTDWCKYPSVVEPGHYLLHPESFMVIGPVDWS